MKRRNLIAAALLAVNLVPCGPAVAADADPIGTTAFWIQLTDPRQVDQQVARLIADHAKIVVIRTQDRDLSTIRPVVEKMKQSAPHVPVLMYTWASHDKHKPGGVNITDFVRSDPDMQIEGPTNHADQDFGNVMLPAYQNRLAANIAAAVKQRGFDGVGIDLAIRTPRYRPGPLAKICAKDASFCTRYADGMDATFAAIQKALQGGFLIYNGLWNFGPGSLEDQEHLLQYANAAIVEYFGGDPKQSTWSFASDMLPYIKAIPQIPTEKMIVVFGRGRLEYSSYEEDYQRQRYLYCAYLLGARANTYFKYQATWVPHDAASRASGIAYYADWLTSLGAAEKPFAEQSGLYSRSFAHGLVVVAPEDGHGGSFNLPHPMYTPEGDRMAGAVTLRPAQGLLLLDEKPSDAGADQHLLDLSLLADWRGAKVSGSGSKAEVTLQADSAPGDHDMLLDAIRQLHPRNTLRLAVQAGAPNTRIQLTAEVDDPAHRTEFAVLDLAATPGAATSKDPIPVFRTTSPPRDAVPVVAGPALTAGTSQQLQLDGHALFAKSGVQFRRWDFARFVGPIKIQSVGLTN